MKVRLIAADSMAKEAWDVLVVVVTIFAAIDIPFKLAYNYSLSNIPLELVITLLFCVDIIIHFNTQIYVKGIVINDRKHIAQHYLRTFFVFDLVAAVPFPLVAAGFPAIVPLSWLSLTRLFKLVRIHTVISRWKNRQAINPSLLRLGIFFFWIFLLAHWIACVWVYIARIEQFVGTPPYIDAIYWCITTITTVGYGDISPVTDLQKIWTMMAMIVGVGIYAYVIGNIASLLSHIDVAKASFSKQMEDINSFLSYKSVPKRVKQKVHNYYQYLWDNRLMHCEHELLTTLPQSLKTEISTHLHKQLIEHVPFFKNTDTAFISHIISQLKLQVFLPGDFIFRRGDIGNCMYFICNGSVDVLSDDESTSVATLKEGDYFGEIALVKKVARTRSVVAKEYCNLYILEKTDFDALLEKYPEFKKHIYDTIKERQKEPPELEPK
ncbi:MAG: ion transporter [Candidatus Thermoplasmatota archaeon]|nr:ion transporter [Candidatus Thermoplasmatota archaeon]